MSKTLPLPTRRFAALVAALSVLVLIVPTSPLAMLILCNLVAVVVGLIDWRLAPNPSQLGVERDLPKLLALGQTGDVIWRVSNPSSRSVDVRLCDELVPSLGPVDRRCHLVVPAGRTGLAHTTIRPTRRGRFEPDRITVRVAGPLGIVARQADVSRPGSLRVDPRYRSRYKAELLINRLHRNQLGVRVAHGVGGMTEFDALREYTIDDPIRRIDWSATARAGRAIVKTYRTERNQQVICLLDCGRTMAARIQDEPRFEHAIDAVMMLTQVASRLGDKVGLVAFDAQIRAVVSPSSATTCMAAVTDAMYDIEPRLMESDYRGAFVETLGRFRRRSMLVLFSELAEQAVADTLMPALPMVVRDHVVVVASVVDPNVERWARGVPTNSDGVYLKAAAIASLEERKRVTRRLQRLGVTVVDAVPGALASGLADSYLKVKTHGRL